MAYEALHLCAAHASRFAFGIDRQRILCIQHIRTLCAVGEQSCRLALHAGLTRIGYGNVHGIIRLSFQRVENWRHDPRIIRARESPVTVDSGNVGRTIRVNAAVCLEEGKRSVVHVRVDGGATDDSGLWVGDSGICPGLGAGRGASLGNAHTIILAVTHLCKPCGDARVRVTSCLLIKNGDCRSPHGFERDCHALERLVICNVGFAHA